MAKPNYGVEALKLMLLQLTSCTCGQPQKDFPVIMDRIRALLEQADASEGGSDG